MACFVPIFGQFLLAIRFRKGPVFETDELPTIFIKFRKAMNNLPLFGDALFRTPIAAGNGRFRDHFSNRLDDLFCSDILANSYSRLATAKCHFRRQANYHNFPKNAENRGQPTAVWRDPILNPNRG